MAGYFVQSNILFLPLLFAGVIHLFVIHFDLLPFLKRPLSQKFFGENKTYRGFVVIGFLTFFGVFLTSIIESYIPQAYQVGLGKQPYFLGFLLGVFAMLFELPNSFLKRRLGAKSGEHPQKYKMFFYIFNQADSVIGCTLIYALFFDFGFTLLMAFFIYTSFMHLFVNLIFSFLKLRKNPF